MTRSAPRPAPHVRWHGEPPPARVLLAAFEGWNDAGDAASLALAHLDDAWSGTSFADIDPEEFYDFSTTRPQVRFDDDDRREIVWPTNRCSFATPHGRSETTTADDAGVVLLRGVEPQLRWRTFCDQVLAVAEATKVDLVLTVGALLAEVPHSRPVPVFGAAYEDEVVEQLGLLPSRYEGPTGIVGVLHATCADAGLRSASLWAAVPSYLPSAPSPKAALALVRKITDVLDVGVDGTALEIATANYERSVDAAARDDDDTADYIAQLEQRFDEEGSSLDAEPTLADEIEAFLRDQD
ncbi:MAG: PAC2 family protein [Acidimicrobiales bacterium]|nr:PAC2 family protein [Acidimicrobiales bacterium]